MDILLSALSPPTSTSTSTSTNNINVKRFHEFGASQTERLFEFGLCGVDTITLCYMFLTSEQLNILHKVESKYRYENKQVNLQLFRLDFNCMFALPSLGTRHISLYEISNYVNDNDLIELKTLITSHKQFHCDNFDRYKILLYDEPFIQKNTSSTQRSFYLQLHRVYFINVSPNVFASTFSFIPSLECDGDDDLIPSSHWKELLLIEDTNINQLRIWYPTLDNLEHFIKIKAKTLQLICNGKDKLKEVLVHIANSGDVQLDKTIKVFVVKYDENNYDYYEEIVVCGKTIEEFKNNYTSNILELDDVSRTVPFYEGEQHLKNWCCEICFGEKTLWNEFKNLFKRK